MKKYGVIVCSNAATDYIEAAKEIEVFRSVIIFGDKEYNDFVDMTTDEFYNRCLIDKDNFPHTAYVSRGFMLETFESMKGKGYDGAFVITIASALSGLNNTVKLVGEEVEGFDVVVYDSKSLSYPEAKMAITARDMFEAGASVEEVVAKLDFIKSHNHIFFAVDTLEYLIRNGRLSRAKGAIANLLKIRPMLHIDANGKVESLETARTSTKARRLMALKFLEEVKGKKAEAFFVNTNNDEGILEAKKVLEENNYDTSNMKTYLLTPVVGAHAGPGTIGLGFIEIEE